jgi:hypothetical protein
MLSGFYQAIESPEVRGGDIVISSHNDAMNISKNGKY